MVDQHADAQQPKYAHQLNRKDGHNRGHWCRLEYRNRRQRRQSSHVCPEPLEAQWARDGFQARDPHRLNRQAWHQLH